MGIGKKAAIAAAIIIPVAVLIAIVILFGIQFNSCTRLKMAEDWKAETQLVPYVMYTSVYDDNKDYELCLRSLFDKYHDVMQVFTIFDSRIYFLYSVYEDYDNSKSCLFNIAYIDMNNTKDICILYSEIFEPLPEYYMYTEKDYSERSSFYYDGKIVVKDDSKLIEYDVKTDTVKEYDPKEYQYPQKRYQYTVNEDGSEILLKDTERGIEKLITLDDMASNQYMQQILSVKDETLPSGLSRIDHFLRNVQELNGKAYIVGSMSNPQGEEFAVLFEYDIDSSEFKYVLNCWSPRYLNDEFYLLEYLED